MEPLRYALLGKRMLWPGIDLHARCRYRWLPPFFEAGPIRTLDAGFGNGSLSYAAYRKGNSVLGVTIEDEQVNKAKRYFSFFGIASERLAFRRHDLNRVSCIGESFGQVICAETLEHIKDDIGVLKQFNLILSDGGVLHICVPNARHPEHALGRHDEPEDGRHVRDGYTFESLRCLLHDAGFSVIEEAGLGSPLIATVDRWVRSLASSIGLWAGVVAFVLVAPVQWLDHLNPEVPFSLYVKAVKRSPGG